MIPSLRSKIFAGILKILNFKKIIEKRAQKPIPRSKKGFVPKSLKRSHSVHIQTLHAHTVATFESKAQASHTHVIFLHGGAYIFEAAPGHWDLAKKIVDKSFCRMTLVDYPLAPEHNYRDTFVMVGAAYEKLVDQYPDDDFVLMGDSAGGGLALAFAQKLIMDNHRKLPVKNILLSPWLDLAMSNPEIEKQKATDHILTVAMLRIAGAKYAHGDDPQHFLLSPINGALKDIPSTLVFYGTQELFYADCKKLQSLVQGVNEHFVFREYPGMQHDWAIFPIPERERVVDEICA